MQNKYKGRMKILIVFGLLFLIVSVLLMLIFLDSKKTYTVQFDPNGGTVLSGSLEQRVLQGQDAVPPSVVMDGAVLRGWSTSYRRITKNVVIEAVWEYETTAGIIYTESENQNFTEIQGSYPHLRGEIYLDAFFNEKKVLGILDGAFANQTQITKVYLLDGLLAIEKEAFSGCTALTEIKIPDTVMFLGEGTFSGCESLEKLTLSEGLLEIGTLAFENCTALTEVIIPESVTVIEENAFAGCTNLVIKVSIPKEEWPAGWAADWFGDATVEIIEPETEETEKNDKNDKNDTPDKADKDNKED